MLTEKVPLASATPAPTTVLPIETRTGAPGEQPRPRRVACPPGSMDGRSSSVSGNCGVEVEGADGPGAAAIVGVGTGLDAVEFVGVGTRPGLDGRIVIIVGC